MNSAGAGVQRLTGLAGLATMLAWVVAYTFGVGLPGADATPSQLAAYATDHGIELEIFGVLLSTGATTLLVFQVGLSQLLRTTDASLRTLATTGLVGGVASQTLVIVGCALIQVQVLAPDPSLAALSGPSSARRSDSWRNVHRVRRSDSPHAPTASAGIEPPGVLAIL